MDLMNPKKNQGFDNGYDFEQGQKKGMVIKDTKKLLNRSSKNLFEKNIKGYDKIVIKDVARGSLQSKPIFEVVLTPSGSVIDVHSILKFSSKASVKKEKTGRKILNNFFDDLGEYLLPNPEYWPIRTPTNSNCHDIIVTIPKITGTNFTEYVSNIDKNVYGHNKHKEIFKHVHKIKDFIKTIAVNKNTKINTGRMIQDHLFNTKLKEARRRYNKITTLLKSINLPEDSQFLTIENIKVTNSLYFLLNHRNYMLKRPHHETTYYSYAHGDFHLGNIYINKRNKITILDYDYIGPKPKEYDLATFEASMFLRLIHRFNKRVDWTSTVKPIIKDYYQLRLMPDHNRHTKRMIRILSAINSVERGSFTYKSCLLIAYSRLLTSYVKKDKIKENAAIATTCIIIIGKLIEDLYSIIDTNTTETNISFFE
jgi:thiamine kinase-like enzyme